MYVKEDLVSHVDYISFHLVLHSLVSSTGKEVAPGYQQSSRSDTEASVNLDSKFSPPVSFTFTHLSVPLCPVSVLRGSAKLNFYF